MARHKRHGGKDKDRRAPIPLFGADPRQQGLRAFQAGRFDEAIGVWSGLAASDARAAAALAEAHFRRALTVPAGSGQLADLRRADALAPDDPRYLYHLGLALHHARELPEAIDRYRAVLARDPVWPGAAVALALAALEQEPAVDLAALPGSTPMLRLTLSPVQALLRGAPVLAPGDGPLEQLWQGLSLIGRDGAAARVALDDDRSLPSARADKVRRYYRGVAAATTGDLVAALEPWRRAYAEGLGRPWLADNLAAALLRCLESPDADPTDPAGVLARAAALTPDALALAPGYPALAEAVIGALDDGAHAAAAAGDWARAAALWESARDVVGAGAGLGSPRPLLHNLALAYEAQDRWPQAADTWRAMLRTRPRRRAGDGAPRASRGKAGKGKADRPAPAVAAARDGEAAGDDVSAAQWAWVRRRVIECYQRAGQPGEAVAVFRQALKADPDDVEMRVQLADALLANGQEQAAYNEVRRAAEAAPENDDVQLRLGGIQLERGERRAAEVTLRRLLHRSPDRAEGRRLLARLYLESGHALHAAGQYAAAIRNLEEGRQLAPDDYQFPLNLARVAIDQGKRKEAPALLARALELGADQPEAYAAVLECWAVADDLAAARAVVARAEDAFSSSSEFYVDAGSTLLRSTAAPALPYGLGAPAAPRKNEDAWRQLGAELLARGMALRPDDGRLRASVASELLQTRPELALTYAEEAARLLPDEASVLILLGMLRALNGRTREAKEALQRAARQARKQGDAAMAQEIELLRQQVDSPLLPLMLSMGSPFGPSPDEDDLYW